MVGNSFERSRDHRTSKRAIRRGEGPGYLHDNDYAEQSKMEEYSVNQQCDKKKTLHFPENFSIIN